MRGAAPAAAARLAAGGAARELAAATVAWARRRQPCGRPAAASQRALARGCAAAAVVAHTPVRRAFCVLGTGHANTYIDKHYGQYVDLFERLLRAQPGDAAAEAEVWHKFDCTKGEFPSREAEMQYDGYVLTGSSFDAHGPEVWIEQLRQYVRRLHAAGDKRILGVCFGHQLIANALGGVSGPAAEIGWQLGVREVFPTDAMRSAWYARELLEGIESFTINQMHRDQVLRLPAVDGVQLLASSKHTPVEAYSVGHNILCVQGHPELNNDMVRSVVADRVGSGRVPPASGEWAMCTMELAEPDKDLVTRILRRFLRGSPEAQAPPSRTSSP